MQFFYFIFTSCHIKICPLRPAPTHPHYTFRLQQKASTHFLLLMWQTRFTPVPNDGWHYNLVYFKIFIYIIR